MYTSLYIHQPAESTIQIGVDFVEQFVDRFGPERVFSLQFAYGPLQTVDGPDEEDHPGAAVEEFNTIANEDAIHLLRDRKYPSAFLLFDLSEQMGMQLDHQLKQHVPADVRGDMGFGDLAIHLGPISFEDLMTGQTIRSRRCAIVLSGDGAPTHSRVFHECALRMPLIQSIRQFAEQFTGSPWQVTLDGNY
jgi:hypothetical protein